MEKFKRQGATEEESSMSVSGLGKGGHRVSLAYWGDSVALVNKSELLGATVSAALLQFVCGC